NASHTLLDASYASLVHNSELTYVEGSRTLSQAAAARVTTSLRVIVTSGISYDFTLSIGPSFLSRTRSAATILTMGSSIERLAHDVNLLLPANRTSLITLATSVGTDAIESNGFHLFRNPDPLTIWDATVVAK